MDTFSMVAHHLHDLGKAVFLALRFELSVFIKTKSICSKGFFSKENIVSKVG